MANKSRRFDGEQYIVDVVLKNIDKGKPRIRDLIYVKAATESWARWCGGSRGRGISLTGRLMQGARGNVCQGWLDDAQAHRAHDPWCPDCKGTGRLLLKLTATRRSVSRDCPVCENESDAMGKPTPRRENCFRCHGLGVVTVVSLKVNPAAIRSTAHVGGAIGGDWQSLILDDLITGWRERDETFWLNRVVVREYFFNGTQRYKAQQMRVSPVWYNRRLLDAYRRIDQTLFESMPRG